MSVLKAPKCYFYRDSSCYLLYITPAVGRILNILPAPFMEMRFGVIWILVGSITGEHQIYADPVAPGCQQPGHCRFLCFLCSCHVPVLQLVTSRAMWGAALSVPPAGTQPLPKAAAPGGNALEGSLQWGEMNFYCLVLPIKSHFPPTRSPPELHQECVGPDKNSFPFVQSSLSVLLAENPA